MEYNWISDLEDKFGWMQEDDYMLLKDFCEELLMRVELGRLEQVLTSSDDKLIIRNVTNRINEITEKLGIV